MFVYLTGGIGSGKSTALSMFAELGAQVVSADAIIRSLLSEPGVQQRVAALLGIPDPSDRAVIAAKVFSDETALRRLESLLHPLVAEQVAGLRREIAADDMLVYEVPLLPVPLPEDVVVTLEAPIAVRLQRLADRGLSAADAEARMASQPDAEAYRRIADHIVLNDGDEQQLRKRVERVWKELHSGARHL